MNCLIHMFFQEKPTRQISNSYKLLVLSAKTGGGHGGKAGKHSRFFEDDIHFKLYRPLEEGLQFIIGYRSIQLDTKNVLVSLNLFNFLEMPQSQ